MQKDLKIGHTRRRRLPLKYTTERGRYIRFTEDGDLVDSLEEYVLETWNGKEWVSKGN